MPSSSSPSPHNGIRRRSNIRLIVSIGVGFVALTVGVSLVLTTSGSASFGWFAYAPLSGAIFSPYSFLMTQQGQLGLLTGILGLLILAFSVGWGLGRRGSRRS